MRQRIYVDVIKIAFAGFIAVATLVFTVSWKIDLENQAKGEQNTLSRETTNGKPYTASNITDIEAVLDSLDKTKKSDTSNPSCNSVIWLGNSQLHYINQYQKGDHLAPYWLRLIWNDRSCIEPLGLSLPNADLQEFLILSRYAAIRSEVKLLIIELVFDDLREDAVRDDFAALLSPEMATEIRHSSRTADAIVSRLLVTNKDVGNSDEKSALSGTIQEPVEKWLNRKLSAAWNLWAGRPQIEGNLFLGIYNLRNYVFGINPTTVRKMIRSRYDLNMEAFRDILVDYQKRNIPVLLYIAPIRQDKPIPYDRNEYAQWKHEVNEIARRYGAYLVNLEKLVPDNMWGSYSGDDIDFMHFQGPGHRLVAEALLPYIRKILKATAN